MSTVSFDYVPEFDMSTAIYDGRKEFFNSYMKRQRLGVKGSIANLMKGDVKPCHTSSYQYGYPVMHMPTGEMLLLRNIGEPDNRGRYTFGGYDFTVVGTGDPLFSKMAEFINLPDYFTSTTRPPAWPKMNKAAFHTNISGESQMQELVFDHVHNRVYSLHSNAEEPKVPEAYKGDSFKIYAASPRHYWLSHGVIRMTLPRTGKNVPAEYKDLQHQCAMWFQFEGSDLQLIYNEHYKTNVSMHHSQLKRVIDPDFAVKKGFANLDRVERALIAKNGEIKNLPRLAHTVPWLDFNSRAFFSSINL